MSSITKLNYLSDTKDLIKAALNDNFNAGITDEDTFRSYVDKIRGIYNNWEKVTGENTELSLSPTRKGKMNITLKGNTEQASYSGKNLFDADGTYYVRNQNTTISINGSEITATNLSSSGAGFVWWNIPVTSGQNYTISYADMVENPESVNNNLSYKFSNVPITEYTSEFTDYTQYTKINKTNKVSTAEATDGYLVLVHRITTSASNKITGIQVEQGSTATSYEQYVGGIPSPNSSYPQTVHAVTGNNTINVGGTNYSINLGSIELCNIGTHQDLIFKNTSDNPYYDSTLVENGWYKYGAINKVTLDGTTETWGGVTTSNEFKRIDLRNIGILNEGTARNTHIFCSISRASKIDGYNIVFNYGDVIFFYLPQEITDSASWKELLSQKLPKLYYILAEATTTQITDTTLIEQLEAISNAMSVTDTTNIIQTNADLPFIINASALKKGGN